MKYFQHNGLDYHCDDIFNYKAVDKDGTVWLYEQLPFTRVHKGYWTSGYHSSYDYQVYVKAPVEYLDWTFSLERLV